MSHDNTTKEQIGVACMYCGTLYNEEVSSFRGCCGEVHFEPVYECDEGCSCDLCYKPKMHTITKEEFNQMMGQ